nr:unnamed protein product [Digitaria exilis]
MPNHCRSPSAFPRASSPSRAPLPYLCRRRSRANAALAPATSQRPTAPMSVHLALSAGVDPASCRVARGERGAPYRSTAVSGGELTDAALPAATAEANRRLRR